ncbi:MAG TPA: hypothetical protein DCS67_04805 [Clostridiales bacterium UBA8960]|nr:hypothetical protein [Clostridiales bacterium UBA8960]
MPDRGEEASVKLTKFIDERILETPTIAIKSVINETVNMGEVALNSLTCAMDGYFEGQIEKVKKTFVYERDVNALETLITEFLVKLSSKDLLETDRRYIDGLFNNINDIERVGDHADNIAELIVQMDDKNIAFSEGSKQALLIMYNKTKETYQKALQVIDQPNVDLIKDVIKIEEEMDILQKKARHDHFERLNSNICSTEAGIYYLEIVNNLERVSDLSCNLVRMVADTVEI